MKRIEPILISIVLFWLMMPLASAYALNTQLISQDPMPVNNGDVVEVFFKTDIKFSENPPENLVVKIFPEHPFSLITGENDTIEFGNVVSIPYTESFTFKYKLLVDENANEGDNKIKVGYSVDGGKNFITRDHIISVAKTSTDFDVIAQDISESSTTLAVVNIGANTGYSVIMRIPEQENFRVTGASANVMGNIDAGDYTLAIFQITPTSNEKNLVVEISYTDGLGIRRTIEKEVSLGGVETMVTSETGQTGTRIQSNQIGQRQTSGGSGLMYIGIGIVGIIAIVAFLKLRKNMKRKKK